MLEAKAEDKNPLVGKEQATMLRQKGVDIKTTRELLSHANSRITLDIDQQSVTEEKRHAQNLAFTGFLKPGPTQHPRRGLKEETG